MRTVQYLDAIKTKRGITSDYAVAKLLQITPQKVSNWRAGRDCPGTLACWKIAELLEADRDLVLASIELERSEKAGKPDQASAWREWLEKLGGVAAAILMGTVLSAPSPAAASMKTTASEGMDSVYYVKSITV